MTHDTNKSQQARFVEIARAIGADEDMEAFRAKLGVIARQKPVADAAQPLSKEGTTHD